MENEEGSTNDLINFVEEDLKYYEQTLAELLSASDQLCFELDHALSSVPVHPYHRLVHDHLSGNFTPVTLADVEIPSNFSIETVSNQLCSIAMNYSDNFDAQVVKLSSGDFDQYSDPLCNAFAFLSGDSLVVDDSKIANHLKYVGFLNSIPIQAIEEDPIGTAQKMISQFLRTY